MLVTRPEPGATATARALVAMGLRPVVAPFLTVRRCTVKLPRVDRLQAVIAASGNATSLPAGYRGLPLLAVGNATAARARAAGFGTVHSAAGTATELAALAGARLHPDAGPVLLATGRGQGTKLRRALRRQGFTVHRRAVYAAAAPRRFPAAAAAAVAAGLRAVLFFSAATAAAFARTCPAGLLASLAGTDALVIGPAAGHALDHLPWRTVRVALRPTQDGILALL